MAQPTASYRTIELRIPEHLVEDIRGVTTSHGTWQRPYQRIRDSWRQVDGEYRGRVREEDIELMKEWARDPGEGSYERWAAEILALNGIALDS